MFEINIILMYGFIVLALDLGKFHFFPRRHPFVLRDGNEERVLIWEHSHSITPFFPVFSTYPPYFLLTFSKHRSYLVFIKRFYYLRNTLFSFYEQSVQKHFKTSQCFAMAQHHFLESIFSYLYHILTGLIIW